MQGRAKLGEFTHLDGGRVDEDMIRNRFKQHKAGIVECYSREVRGGVLAKGTIEFDFTVWDDGCSAEVKGRYRDKALGKTATCVVGILKGLCFEAPSPGPAKYRAAIYFEPAPPTSQPSP
jgi:hypothetical protein